VPEADERVVVPLIDLNQSRRRPGRNQSLNPPDWKVTRATPVVVLASVPV